MSKVIILQPKEAINTGDMLIPFSRIKESFRDGDLKLTELSKIMKKYPHFKRWWFRKHPQVFA